MDPLSAVVGVVIFVVGVVVGRRQRRKGPVGREPVCGCEHHLSMHDPKTGHCHGRIQVSVVPRGGSRYTEWHDCTCRRYVGPQPLTDVWAEPIAIDHDKT